MNRPTDLTPIQFTALLYMLNMNHWRRDDKGNVRPPTGTALARFMGYNSNTHAYKTIARLCDLGYLDSDLKGTEKCYPFTRSLGTNSVEGING